MKGFKNAKVCVENCGIINCDVAVENGIIVAIGEDLAIEQPYEIGTNSVVLPGFIDEHIHGANGCDAMDASLKALGSISTAIASEGTTGFLATTMTQSPQNIINALSCVGEFMSEKQSKGAALLGAHLEGPFISLKHVGAQPKEYVAKPNVETYKQYEKASRDNIKIVSLAPEVEGAQSLIEYLKIQNLVALAGHSDAKFSDIESAVSYGLRGITHTYNAQTPLHHREIGVVGSAMLIDELYCEIICDTIHVCVPAIKLLMKNKPHDKITLITDSMRAKHLPDGESELGGQKVIVKNGEARLVDGTLAGSVLKMNIALKNVVEKVGVPLLTAIDFASINPARNLKLDNKIGSIRVGKNADFAVLNDNFDVLKTILNGEIIYSR